MTALLAAATLLWWQHAVLAPLWRPVAPLLSYQPRASTVLVQK